MGRYLLEECIFDEGILERWEEVVKQTNKLGKETYLEKERSSSLNVPICQNCF